MASSLTCTATSAQLMVEQATAIITYKEYPHTDTADRAVELFNLIVDTVEGKVKPTMSLFDAGMIALYYPTQEPMKSYVDRLKALEGKDGVLSVSLGHGFPWGDVPDLGTKTLVVTDNDPAGAERTGRKSGARILRHARAGCPALLRHRRRTRLRAGGSGIADCDCRRVRQRGRRRDRATRPSCSGACWNAASPTRRLAASGIRLPPQSPSKRVKARSLTCASAARWASCPAIRSICTSPSAKSRSTRCSISARTMPVRTFRLATQSPSAPTASTSC